VEVSVEAGMLRQEQAFDRVALSKAERDSRPVEMQAELVA
jgi:hypothetical protein